MYQKSINFNKIILSLFVIILLGDSARSDTNSSSSPNSSTSVQVNITTTTVITSTKNDQIVSDCKLSKSSKYERVLLEKLKTMRGEKYTWEDDEHKYYFSICSAAENSNQLDQGFVQVNKKQGKTYVLGRLNDVDLEGATNLIRIDYKNGDPYRASCNKEERNAIVYLLCDPNAVNSTFKMIEENNERDEACSYVFELTTQKVCDVKPTTTSSGQTTFTTERLTTSGSSSASGKTKLGFFSITIIVLVSLLMVYLVVGTLFLRFVKKARGWEQVPNFGFWSTIGNASADCCNYVCRCGNRTTEIHTYENINDRLSDDENLLNM